MKDEMKKWKIFQLKTPLSTLVLSRQEVQQLLIEVTEQHGGYSGDPQRDHFQAALLSCWLRLLLADYQGQKLFTRYLSFLDGKLQRRIPNYISQIVQREKARANNPPPLAKSQAFHISNRIIAYLDRTDPHFQENVELLWQELRMAASSCS